MEAPRVFWKHHDWLHEYGEEAGWRTASEPMGSCWLAGTEPLGLEQLLLQLAPLHVHRRTSLHSLPRQLQTPQLLVPPHARSN
jgi:hypothetical protein